MPNGGKELRSPGNITDEVRDLGSRIQKRSHSSASRLERGFRDDFTRILSADPEGAMLLMRHIAGT